LQFHPESILTEQGLRIIKNFLKIAGDMHND
jgi:anthranilate/para-aminobenzoate synthase component II